MQGIFLESQELTRNLANTLTHSRLSRYLRKHGGNLEAALVSYHHNAQLCAAFYIPLQMWEVALRNRINVYLIRKFGPDWPYNTQVSGELRKQRNYSLSEAIDRQQKRRRIVQIPTDAIVADLSIGFWVSLLGRKYDVAFGWARGLPAVFPHRPRLTRSEAHEVCERLRVLRNRIAHHEPILDESPEKRWVDIGFILSGLCTASETYVRMHCPPPRWSAPAPVSRTPS